MKVKSIKKPEGIIGEYNRLWIVADGHKTKRVIRKGAGVTIRLMTDASPNPVTFEGEITSFNFQGNEDAGSAVIYAKFEVDFKAEAPEVTMSFEAMKRLVEGTLGKKVRVIGVPRDPHSIRC